VSNTEFFREVRKEDSSITWKDIFSDSFRKHSKADMEYAMQTGTLARQVPEGRMLQTWNKPWLWWQAAKYGLGLMFGLYAVFYMCAFFLGAVSNSLGNMVMIIPPVVIPLIILILLWELNVPQNISLMDLLAFFLVGGIACFAINSAMFLPFPSGLPSYFAAVREEPSKLGAALLILLYIERVQKKKIYGMTGLVVGAAVGAAFSGIESVSYAINYSDSAAVMIDVQLTRALLALGGHITYCVPYATAIALKAKNGRITASSIFNPMTIGAFLFSVGLHAIWNGSGSSLIQWIIVGGSLFILLYWVKKSMQQMVRICTGGSFSGPVPESGGITVCCRSTSLQGMRWQSRGESLVIGRQKDKCSICFGEDARGVSRQHCKILKNRDGWFIQDLGSSYGTYVGGRKLAPYELYPLHSGENIYLGSKQVWLTVM